uniref:Putative lipocalin n=1 Tax=Rhodnius neglectus TaxID=72488 RepID=A0A0P4VK80_9HEMI
MKTIIAVAFFGLLGHTFSADADTTTLDSSECPDVKTKAMKDFKPEKFFTGTWYLTHLKHRNHSSICPTFTLKPTPPTIDYTYGVTEYPGMTFNMHCDGFKVNVGQILE